jgi:hypothetical protein
MYRIPASAPSSALPAERRGQVVGRFCRVCGSVYPLHAARHAGKPEFGRDHVASPCAQEGRPFLPDAEWWEPAVELLPTRPATTAP